MEKHVLLARDFLKPLTSLLSDDYLADINHSDKPELVQALATTIWDKIDRPYLEQYPNLKLISHLGIGVDNIDLDYVKQHNIKLFNTPHLGFDDTAELAIALMLTLSRAVIPNHNNAVRNDWQKSNKVIRGHTLQKKVCGIVGLGKLGKSIAKRAKVMGMEIVYHGPNKKDVAYQYYPDLKEMIKDINWLVLSCPGGEQTKHLINKEIIHLLGPNKYLVNVARGSVVDEKALIEALQNNMIAGAALDVYESEPYVPEEFFSLDNVVCSPHVGSSTHENLADMFDFVAKQINENL